MVKSKNRLFGDIATDIDATSGRIDSASLDSDVATTDASANFASGLQVGGVPVAADSNLNAFVSQFDLPTSDGSADQYLKTNGSSVIGFASLPSNATTSDDGFMSSADKTKLDGIETSADVTDATNVAAAGAVMESDTTTANMSFVVDEDNMASDSATKLPTQQSVKAYVDTQLATKDALSELSGDSDDITAGSTNLFMTTAERTKLTGIETGATADQTASEIEAIVSHDNLQGFVANEHIDWTTDQGSDNIHTNNFPPDVTISNDLTVSGDLIVTGSTTQAGSVVTDNNFTGLTNANTGNATDFGFYGKFVESSTTKYAGLYFDASTNNTFRLFTDSESAPSSTVNESATGYTAANLVVNNITTGGTVDGRDVSADGTKLDGIEAGATADQTDAEIKTAYENNSDTNAFTDALQTKLNGIETSATADQTDAEIKTAYENNSDTNALTDALLSKLNGIESSATADQTASEILTAIKTVDGASSGLDADLLDGNEATHFLNTSTSFGGDVSGTYNAIVIADDSHNHTISNVDDLQTTLDAKLALAGGTMAGSLVLHADPTASLQAATKQYVDTIASAGLHYHQPVRVEHPSNLNASYNNGSSGVGATLTNAGSNAAIELDGVALSLNDRVLVANQTSQPHNGVYKVTTVGDASTPWVLTRTTDTDSYAPSDPDAFGKGDAFFIKEGDTNAGHLDVLSTSGTITFGTTNIIFSEVAETTVYAAGTGLTLTGTTFSADQAIAATATPTFAGLTINGSIGVTGNVDGRDVSADGTKLDGIETGATADQTAAEIRTLVESASDSNVFTDNDHSKLDGIEASATADQTDAEIRAAVEAATDSNVFTDADHTKLNGIEDNATADQTAAEIRTLVDSATDSNVFTDADHTKLDGIESNATADQTDAEIKTAYENNSDTNAFTDALQTKLNGIATSANNYVHPDHSGEVTSTADGATVIADNVVDEANLKVSNSPQNGYFLSAQSGNAGGLTWAAVPAGYADSDVDTHLNLSSAQSGEVLSYNGSDYAWASALVASNGVVDLESTNTGTLGCEIDMYHNSASPGTGNQDQIGLITFQGNSSGGVKQIAAQIEVENSSPSANHVSSFMKFNLGNPFGSDVRDVMQINWGGVHINSLSGTGQLRLEEDVTIRWEGASNNSFETTLQVVDPTADRTVSIPDATGTLALTDDINSTNVATAGAVMDSDFSSNGLMKRTGSGTYSVVTDNSSNWDTAYGWGDHSSEGYLTAHPNISAASSSNNSGTTFIQDVTVDSNGHVTGIGTATVPTFSTGKAIAMAIVFG